MKEQEVLKIARDAEIRLVRFQYCDNGGVIRCKATHVSKLATRIREGIGQTLAMSAWSGAETLAAVEGMGPVGEFRLIPDLDTFTILPYAPNTAATFCN